MSGTQWKNEGLDRVISGLEHHGGIAEWGCWKDSEENPPVEYCPYYDDDSDELSCSQKVMADAIKLLKEYDIALRMMVYQYCTIDKSFLEGKERIIRNPDQEVFFHRFMSAGEEAFRVLGIENGQEVTDDFIWG